MLKISVIDQIKEIPIDGYLTAQYGLSPDKSGKSIFFNCPIHNEKTPSFSVYADGKKWSCFGACSRGGDIIDLVQAIDNLDTTDAIEKLCQYAGIKNSYQISPHLEIVARVADIYYKAIGSGIKKQPLIADFIKSRGISQAAIDHFRIGRTSFGRDDAITEKLLKDYNKKDLIISGVSIEKNDRLIDRHRNSLIIPLLNYNGKTVGFTAFPLPRRDDGKFKHINSPGSYFFSKRNILYGMNFVKRSKDDYIVIVEGYNDIWSLWQSGEKNTVAIIGALTYEHIKQITTDTKKVYLAFDNDKAGIEYIKSFMELLPNGFHLSPANIFIAIYEGGDPDDFISGGGVWLNAMRAAVPVLTYMYNKLASHPSIKDSITDILKRLAPYYLKLQPVEFDLWTVNLHKQIGNQAIQVESIRLQLTQEIEKLKSKALKSRQVKKLLDKEDYVLCSYVINAHILEVGTLHIGKSKTMQFDGLKITQANKVFSKPRNIKIYNHCFNDGVFIGHDVPNNDGLLDYLNILLDGYEAYLDEYSVDIERSLKADVETCVAHLTNLRLKEKLAVGELKNEGGGKLE